MLKTQCLSKRLQQAWSYWRKALNVLSSSTGIPKKFTSVVLLTHSFYKFPLRQSLYSLSKRFINWNLLAKLHSENLLVNLLNNIEWIPPDRIHERHIIIRVRFTFILRPGNTVLFLGTTVKNNRKQGKISVT